MLSRIRSIRRSRPVSWLDRWPPRPNSRRAALPGLTFIEILVVMIILALIAGILVVNLLPRAEQAKADQTKIQIQSLRSALDLYKLDNSGYPTSEQGLAALLLRPDVGTIPANWSGPYITSNVVPTDGWSRDFRFVSDGLSYVVTSLGADGVEGGSELNADISSDQL